MPLSELDAIHSTWILVLTANRIRRLQGAAQHSRCALPERSGTDPVETLLALQVLQPLKDARHIRFAVLPGQEQELLAQLVLAERAFRRALECRRPASERAAVLQSDVDRAGQVRAIVGRQRH